jgi:thiol-disulfide isomerase/thioredoxin
MNKKSFGFGFLTGILLTAFGLFVVGRNFLVQPDVSLKAMQLEDLNGKTVNLESRLGKPLIVNYWATWCAPCRKEFPDFELLKKQWEGKASFLMVSDETTDIIKKFKANNTYSFDYLKAIKGFEKVKARPSTFIYSKKVNLLKST